MARINRSDVIQKAVNDLGLSGNDKIPTEILDKVQLTYDLNRRFSSFIVNAASTATGSATLTLPTPSLGGEIYITAIHASLIKDSACDQATGSLSIGATTDLQGVAKTILQIPVIALTAQDEHVFISLPYPLKIKSGTTMSFTASYTLGVMSRCYVVHGFITSSN